MDHLHLLKTVDLITLLFVIVGALNWGLIGLFGPSGNVVTRIFGEWAFIIYLVVGFSALIHLFNRNYYLPFLGDAAWPCGDLVEKVPNDADTSAQVNVKKPGATVVYWASESASTTQPNPWTAYGQNTNAGVAKADSNGLVTLKVRKPASYKVGVFHRELPKHIHYRVCMTPGMISRVETVNI